MKIFPRHKILKNTIFRNILVLASGTAGAQIILFICMPIITRLYTPEHLGVLGVFITVTSILITLSGLSYQHAIVLPTEERVALVLSKISLLFSICLTIIVFISFLIIPVKYYEILGINEIGGYIYLIPVFIIFNGILQIFEQFLLRKKFFRISANTTFSQAIFNNFAKIGAAKVAATSFTLILITIVNELFKVIMILYNLGFYNVVKKIKILKAINYQEMKKVSSRYKDFPLYRAPEIFLNGISQGLPLIILSSFFGPAAVGYYTLGRSVLAAPTQLLGKSVGDVFYPRIAEAAKNNENIYYLIKKSTTLLFIVGIVPFSVLTFYSPNIFSIVFGTQWEVAGEYARWIAIWSFLGFINKPSVIAIPVLKEQSFFLKYSVISIVLRITSIYLAYIFYMDDILVVGAFCLVSAICNGYLIIFVIRKSKKFRYERNNNENS